MPLKHKGILAAIYILAGIIAFGHAAANYQCIRPELCQADKAMSGFCAAVLWPLYVAWEVFE